jgi:hypothetical protein
LGDTPQWPNKHLLFPLIKDKRKVPEESPRLKALVKRVTELRRASLEVCHCIKEFIFWRIRPLGHREKLSFECSRFADRSHNPTAGRTLGLTLFINFFIVL